MFLIKKIIGGLLMPLPVIILFLLTGVAILWFTRRQKTGKVLVSVALLLLLLCSSTGLSAWMTVRLENSSKRLVVEAAPEQPWIVVLGGGHSEISHIPWTERLTHDSLFRLLEGLRLHRAIPGSRLLLSGGAADSDYTDAELMLGAARELGFDGEVVIEKKSRDTREQAEFVRDIVRDDPVILVTSAMHMPRSLALFAGQGINAIPAPSDFTVRSPDGFSAPIFCRPGGNRIARMERSLHEYLGISWAWMRGQTK